MLCSSCGEASINFAVSTKYCVHLQNGHKNNLRLKEPQNRNQVTYKTE